MKRLTRSKERRLLGVCGGFADYFGIDPFPIRLAWALCFLLAGTGLLAYLICAFVMPDA